MPHRTQTAYQKGVSYSDVTEAVQKVNKCYIDSGATVFQCFYDLEKAFDSEEYNVLLGHLHRVGINGKGWRVISAFYVDTAARYILPETWCETRICPISIDVLVGD